MLLALLKFWRNVVQKMTNEEARNLIIRNRDVFRYDEEMKQALAFAIKALEDKPQGEWIFQYRFLDEDIYKCSNCGGLISIYDNSALSDYKFCQECGTKMKK